MHNSEAIQAWIQGKMATSRILVLVSKTEIRSREFSFSSRSLRMKIINLDLVSMPEIGGDFFSVSSRSLRLSVRNSRSRLDVRDWIRETLILVSRMKKWLSLTSGWGPCCLLHATQNHTYLVIIRLPRIRVEVFRTCPDPIVERYCGVHLRNMHP